MNNPNATITSAAEGLQNDSRPIVGVVLCSFRGAAFIEEQLDSLMAQTWPVSIHVFDDNSDDTTAALAQAKLRNGKDHLHVHVSNLGYVKNFESGILAMLDRGVRYIALSDQDDIWHTDRIEKGMHVLLDAEQGDAGCPLLIHSDLLVVDEHNQLKHPSYFQYRGYSKTPSDHLEVMLGQNGVMGNTVLMNAALAERALPFPAGVHVHDYWLSIVATLYGQRHMIDEPTVRYRIHDANASNSNSKLATGAQPGAKKKLLQRVGQRDFRLPFLEDSRLQVVEAVLTRAKDSSGQCSDAISEQHRQQLLVFQRYLGQQGGRLGRALSMLRGGYLRKSPWHRIRFVIAQLTTRRY